MQITASGANRSMSALGQRQTSKHGWIMSALPPKADIGTRSRNVRYVLEADMQCSTKSPSRTTFAVLSPA